MRSPFEILIFECQPIIAIWHGIFWGKNRDEDVPLDVRPFNRDRRMERHCACRVQKREITEIDLFGRDHDTLFDVSIEHESERIRDMSLDQFISLRGYPQRICSFPQSCVGIIALGREDLSFILAEDAYCGDDLFSFLIDYLGCISE